MRRPQRIVGQRRLQARAVRRRDSEPQVPRSVEFGAADIHHGQRSTEAVPQPTDDRSVQAGIGRGDFIPGCQLQVRDAARRVRQQAGALLRRRAIEQAGDDRQAPGRDAGMIVRSPGLTQQNEGRGRDGMGDDDRRHDEQRDLPGDAARAQAAPDGAELHDRVTSGVKR